MSRFLLLIPICLLPAGCAWLQSIGPSPDVTPVMKEPPPRMNVAKGAQRPAVGSVDVRGADGGPKKPEDSQVVQASHLKDVDPDKQLTGAQIVATVNGSPILASDVLAPYRSKLEEVRWKATPAQLRTVRERVIRQDLETHVERQLLINALKAEFPKKALEKLDEAITKAFDQEIEDMKKRAKVATKSELQVMLGEHGQTLANLRDRFANTQMAVFYFQSKAKKKKTILGRRDLLDYYESHLADYAIPARARWQEIQISFDKHGGREGARKALFQAVAELKGGADFATVAKTHSDGLTAKKGGVWDWTVSGSLADEKIDRALFEQPIGQISQPYESETSFRLIKVVEREQGRWKPFEDLQEEIKAALEAEAKKKASKKLLDDLMRRSTIVTIFDEDENFRPRWKRLAK